MTDTTPTMTATERKRLAIAGAKALLAGSEITLEELIGKEHRFSPTTHLCIHCGISAADDLLENSPCKP